ncbi:MAG: SpoVR family protein, partial [Legionellales bacterium]|nr:SpoVR family protein [Legionellales bacterium]
PYTLGFNIFTDIKRICENPTDEDKQWLSHLVHQDWQSALFHAMHHFKDESFILQYLSPKVIRDMKLFTLTDDEQATEVVISAIHNQQGYQHIRRTLARQYDLSYQEPDIQVYQVNIEGDRCLTLHHIPQNHRPLHEDTNKVLRHLHQLWKFPIVLEILDTEGNVVDAKHYPSETQ